MADFDLKDALRSLIDTDTTIVLDNDMWWIDDTDTDITYHDPPERDLLFALASLLGFKVELC